MPGLNNPGDIPKQWRDVFALIREALPGTVMAGGCLRDRDMGVKVNDIDLFVPEATAKWDDLTAVERILRELGADKVEIMNDKMYPKGVDNHIVGVVEAKFVSCPLRFQLVIGDWGTGFEQLFRRFDYGICMIGYDGRVIQRDPNYWTDRKTKQFRLCTPRSREAFQQSVERYARLKQKYPDWKFNLGHFHAAYGGHSGGIIGSFDYGDTRHITMRGQNSEFVIRADGFRIIDPQQPRPPAPLTVHVDMAGVTSKDHARAIVSRHTKDVLRRIALGD